MNYEIERRGQAREKRTREAVAALTPLELVNHAGLALRRMTPAQQRLSRKLPLEHLALMEVYHRDLYGF